MDLAQLTYAISFWGIAAIAFFAAVMVISQRNPLYSAVYLVLCFFAVAGLYVLLGAHFLAAIQVLVYAGAIMVLFVMIIMFLNLRDEELGPARVTMGKTLGVACALFFCVIILALMHKTYVPDSGFAEMETEKLVAFGTTKEMGKILFTKYLLPFEAASVLLLGAIVGALVLARRPGNGDER